MTTYKNYAAVKAGKPVKWWHEAIMDDLLTFPLDTLKKRGERLNYSPAYLSVLINSDMFKAHYTKRRDEVSAAINNSLAHKTAEAAGKSLDLILETLDEKRTAIPFDKLADFADRSLQRLGYGNSPGGAPVVQLNVDARSVTTVSREDLATARSALRAVEGNRASDSVSVAEKEELKPLLLPAVVESERT